MVTKIKGCLLILLLLAGSVLHAAESPVPMLQQSANSIIETLKQNKASLHSKPEIIHQAVEKHLLPNVDVTGMSRSVLGRNIWIKATANEKAMFEKAFTQLVIRTYSTPLAEYSDETVKFLPIRGDLNGRFLRVNSMIKRSNGQDIPLTYSLVSKNGQWRIYDLSVEGVSLLQSFRSQFASALKNSSITEVVHQMKQRSKAA